MPPPNPNQGRRNAARLLEIAHRYLGCLPQACKSRNQTMGAAETARQHADTAPVSRLSPRMPNLPTTAYDSASAQTRLLFLEQENRGLRLQKARKDALIKLLVEKLGLDHKQVRTSS